MTNPHAFPLEPTLIHVSDEVLDDLRVRLALTRAPLDEGNGDWFYGVPDGYLRELIAYWRDGYDWRKAEAAINVYEHYQVSVAGVSVHFMRKPGRGARPIPLILTHGWPWTFWHWSKVIDPLADPAAYGGDPVDAFDVIVPSLPGFGFPGPLTGFPDVNFWKVADLWHILMTETLGYEKYAAGGCDIGGIVSSQLGHKYADELYGIHIGSGLPLDFFTGPHAWDLARGRPLTDDQPADVRARIIERDRRSASHLAVHMLDGATLAHGLSDSPAGLLAWLLERWNAWSDNGGDVESVFTKDDLLTHATIYWVNNSIATSMRYHANANRYPGPAPTIGPRSCRPRSASLSSPTKTRPASTPPTSGSASSRPAGKPIGSTTSTSTPTTTAATSSPGRTPTPGSATCAAPSTAAGPEQPCGLTEIERRAEQPAL